MHKKYFLKYIVSLSIFLTFVCNPAFAETYSLKILHTNDVHGRLEPIDYKDKTNVGGFAARAKLIKDFKSQKENVLVLDAGDFGQGTLFFKYFDGIPDIKFMQEAGYDAVELGNHEFDKGLGILKKITDTSQLPVLCSNVKFLNNPKLQEKVKPYIIKDYNGFKVGIIGVVAEDLKTLVNNSESFEVYSPIETVDNIVKQIRPQVDLIVVLSHISHVGLDEDIKLAKAVPEIDLIVCGHSHTFLEQEQPLNVCYNGDSTLIVQDGEFGVNLGELNLKIQDKKIKEYNYRYILVNGSDTDKDFARKISKLSRIVNSQSNQKIGSVNAVIDVVKDNPRKGLTTAGVLVNKSIKAKVPDADIILQNAGGLRGSRHTEAGIITNGDIFELYPFDSTICSAEVKGSDIKSVLETSSRFLPDASGGFLQSLGLEYTVDTKKPSQVLSKDGSQILKEGERVSGIKINGKPIQLDKYYKVVMNDYTLKGGDGYSQLKNAKNIIKTGISIQTSIIDFIKKNSPVNIIVEDKINLY